MTRRYEMRRAKGEVAQLVGRALTGTSQQKERAKRTGPVQSRPPKRAAMRWRQGGCFRGDCLAGRHGCPI